MRALARPFSSMVSIGSTNAAVLPEPVWARPRTSLRCRAWGMAWAWMAVGVVYPAAVTASRTLGLRPSSENDM